MARFRVKNRITHQFAVVEAPAARDACALMGWLFGDCQVLILREGRFFPFGRMVGRKQKQEASTLTAN